MINEHISGRVTQRTYSFSNSRKKGVAVLSKPNHVIYQAYEIMNLNHFDGQYI